MRKLLDKLRQCLIVRVGAIYTISAVLIWTIARAAVSGEWSAELVAYVFAVLALIYFFFVLYVTWMIESVSRQDRFVFFVQIVWVYSPILLVSGAGMLVVSSIVLSPINPLLEPLTPRRILYILTLLEYLAVVWMLMSARVARSWAASNAEDADLLYGAEERLFFGVDHSQLESRISSRMYYSFIAGSAAVLFLIIETVISEFIDETFDLPGYTGAIAGALGIAAVIYPFHRVVSKGLSFDPDRIDEHSADDIKSAAKEVGRSITKYIYQSFFSDIRIKQVLPWVVILCVIAATNVVYLFFSGAREEQKSTTQEIETEML